MQENKFKEGTIIKGKDLKGYTLCKILSADMNMKGFQYKTGMNEDINPLVRAGSCEVGLYFCLVQDACKYLDYGTVLATVRIPDDEEVYVDRGKFRTHRLEIREVMSLNEVTTWEYLVKFGADITAGNNAAVRLATISNHLDVVKYLHENGADITADNNFAIRMAAYWGYLEVVKYLYENGADITARNNEAIRFAAGNGYLEVTKYLHEHGADIMARNNEAVRSAAISGYLEVVKYLHKNGADITVKNKHAIRFAEEKGHMDVVRYLKANMM